MEFVIKSALNTLYTNDGLQMEGEGSVCKNYLIYCCCFPIARQSPGFRCNYNSTGNLVVTWGPSFIKTWHSLRGLQQAAVPQMSQETFS